MARQLRDDAAEQAITKALDEVNDKIVKGVKDGEGDEDGMFIFPHANEVMSSLLKLVLYKRLVWIY